MKISSNDLWLRLAALATLTPLVHAQVVIAPGDDGWQTEPPLPSAQSIADFSTMPIPAGFFGPGSDPFSGVVRLRGSPLATNPAGAAGPTDTIVRRMAPTAPLVPGGSSMVPIEIVALNLVSCQPITVTYNSGACGEQWDVRVTLSQTNPQTPGTMTINMNHPDGGNYSATLPVLPRFVFTRPLGGPLVIDAPTNQVTLNTARTGWLLPFGPGNFIPQAQGIQPLFPGIGVDGNGDGIFEVNTIGNTNFTPGMGTSGCSFKCAYKPLDEEASMLARHGISPPGDSDSDGYPNVCDNCPNTPNPTQADADGDGIGDACDGSNDIVAFNEIYASHSGTDTLEFIELKGAPGTLLTDLFVLVVEGSGALAGTLDKIIPLTGNVIPASGYFVIGDGAVANVNLVIGVQDSFENDTETFYIVRATSPSQLNALLGLQTDVEGDGTTRISCVVDRIIETVAMRDAAAAARVYDGADKNALGPDGAFFPAGIYRGLDFPNPWCGSFLDFIPGGPTQPQTPGAANPACPSAVPTFTCSSASGPSCLNSGSPFCSNGTLGTDHTTACPCGNVGLPANGCAHSFNANGANMVASGSVVADTVQLFASGEPATSFTLFMQHDAAGDTIFHDGVLCAGGTLIRLRGRAAGIPPLNPGEATFPNPAFDSSITLSQRGSVTIGSGAVRRYAAWFRNASTSFCPPATANVTNGWTIVW